jgi:ABC-type multidrug transport system fused ATPase/permease subunit
LDWRPKFHIRTSNYATKFSEVIFASLRFITHAKMRIDPAVKGRILPLQVRLPWQLATRPLVGCPAVAYGKGFMLTISEVSKAYGPQVLFEDVSLQINRTDRVGLIGPNGAGKSTLFSLILGTEEPDKGTIAREKNVAVGHLPQECAPARDGTVL